MLGVVRHGKGEWKRRCDIHGGELHAGAAIACGAKHEPTAGARQPHPHLCIVSILSQSLPLLLVRRLHQLFLQLEGQGGQLVLQANHLLGEDTLLHVLGRVSAPDNLRRDDPAEVALRPELDKAGRHLGLENHLLKAENLCAGWDCPSRRKAA
ncbi:hypothetical protein EGW08_004036 [Elysia chlorotica]|uniref:Uncharacterized protein n=1 Tax=Elysia chlorotica TaxID=188477 RepID=A0A3S0ZX52_ELYCH|nr:hypothetical protein EGW08_004036 [Elysia chlorotica]